MRHYSGFPLFHAVAPVVAAAAARAHVPRPVRVPLKLERAGGVANAGRWFGTLDGGVFPQKTRTHTSILERASRTIFGETTGSASIYTGLGVDFGSGENFTTAVVLPASRSG